MDFPICPAPFPPPSPPGVPVSRIVWCILDMGLPEDDEVGALVERQQWRLAVFHQRSGPRGDAPPFAVPPLMPTPITRVIRELRTTIHQGPAGTCLPRPLRCVPRRKGFAQTYTPNDRTHPRASRRIHLEPERSTHKRIRSQRIVAIFSAKKTPTSTASCGPPNPSLRPFFSGPLFPPSPRPGPWVWLGTDSPLPACEGKVIAADKIRQFVQRLRASYTLSDGDGPRRIHGNTRTAVVTHSLLQSRLL